MSTYKLMHQCSWCPSHTAYIVNFIDGKAIGTKCYYMSPEEMAESGFEDGEAWTGFEEEGILYCEFCEKTFEELHKMYKKRLKKEAMKTTAKAT